MIRRLWCRLVHRFILPRLEQRDEATWLVTRCASCGRELAAYRTAGDAK
jgi:ribosomal protein S14